MSMRLLDSDSDEVHAGSSRLHGTGRYGLAALLLSLIVLGCWGAAHVAGLRARTSKSSTLSEGHQSGLWSNDTVGNASETLSRGRVNESESVEHLMLLQFNPHWECFESYNHGKCGIEIYKTITRFLHDHDIDFANIVDLPAEYRPPEGWKMNCNDGGGGDADCIIWKQTRWSWISPITNCYFGHGRACNVMTFERLGSHGDVVTVAGGHLPHGSRTSWYYEFLETVRQAIAASREVTRRVVLLADANAGLHEKSDEDLLMDLGVGSRAMPRLWYNYRTCCNDNGFDGFFDRIAANFGKGLDLVKDSLYEELSQDYTTAPQFAWIEKPSGQWGAFHQPVIARLEL